MLSPWLRHLAQSRRKPAFVAGIKLRRDSPHPSGRSQHRVILAASSAEPMVVDSAQTVIAAWSWKFLRPPQPSNAEKMPELSCPNLTIAEEVSVLWSGVHTFCTYCGPSFVLTYGKTATSQPLSPSHFSPHMLLEWQCRQSVESAPCPLLDTVLSCLGKGCRETKWWDGRPLLVGAGGLCQAVSRKKRTARTP